MHSYIVIKAAVAGPTGERAHTLATVLMTACLPFRMYIGFKDSDASAFGWNDMTIEDLRKSRAAQAK